jgi:hypothetical protein
MGDKESVLSYIKSNLKPSNPIDKPERIELLQSETSREHTENPLVKEFRDV